MTLKLDRSCSGIVVTCDQCDYWSAFQFEEERAWASAVDHAERVHPGDFQAHKAAHIAATRRAVRQV